jgi:secreted PhoX family phosphatase
MVTILRRFVRTGIRRAVEDAEGAHRRHERGLIDQRDPCVMRALVAQPRFLTGPANCEVTGVVTTPDGRTMFVNIQHPGETPSERSNPARPTAVSAWPGNGPRPRSATIAIRKKDGGVIGT